MKRRGTERGSFSNKKSGPKSDNSSKKSFSNKKSSFHKKDDRRTDNKNSEKKSFRGNEGGKKFFDKDKSFSKGGKKSDFGDKKFDRKDRGEKSFDKDKSFSKEGNRSDFGNKKFDRKGRGEDSFNKEKSFSKGKRPDFGNKNFQKKDRREDSYNKEKKFSDRNKEGFETKDKNIEFSFEKKPAFEQKRDHSSRKHKSFSENRRDFKRKEADKNSPFEKKSFSKNKDFSKGKDKPFSKNKKSDFKKKDFDKHIDKNAQIPEYDLKRPVGAKKSTASTSDDGLIRLNRFIANAGVCSRREADTLIELGEISVNGKVVTELGFKVGREDEVKYQNRTIKAEKPVYILLNKPKDFITTTDDPQDRKTVMALVQNACKERIYPVGRLDRNTTGILLLTNDGELAKKLTHPSSNIKKLYQADLDKPLTTDDFDKILNGLQLEDGPAYVDALAYVSPDKRSLGVEIHGGRNRIVRRIFEHLGYDVERLDRVMYAGLTKKDLPRGKWKFLSEKEVIQLKFFL